MTENLQLASQLMIVGMLSVFTILGIVVALGRVLIYLVNKYSPEPQKKVQALRRSSGFSKQKIAAITAVVDIVTNSKGVVKSIKKL